MPSQPWRAGLSNSDLRGTNFATALSYVSARFRCHINSFNRFELFLPKRIFPNRKGIQFAPLQGTSHVPPKNRTARVGRQFAAGPGRLLKYQGNTKPVG